MNRVNFAKSALVIMTCVASALSQFGSQVDSGTVAYVEIDEASGIASSKQYPGVLWTHNDSGDKNRIYAMSGKGKHLGIYYIKNSVERDWEDIAVGPGPDQSKSYIYVGNMGDNDSVYDIKYVYRCEEPVVSVTQSAKTDTIKNVDVLQFRYPDGKRDAETVMVDPFTKDYYIVSKRESKVRVYKASYPQPLTTVDTLECIDTLDIAEVVAGDISPDGLEIVLKTYKKIYYWKRIASETIKTALSRNPSTVSYKEEPQGEGLAWDHNGSGYFTLSEEDGSDCKLYYYPRLIINVKNKLNEYHAVNMNSYNVSINTKPIPSMCYTLNGKTGSKITSKQTAVLRK